MTHQTTIKTEPIFNEDQEDLIMSYLNSDYMSTNSCWSNVQNTPPTPRPTPTHGLSPISTPESQFRTKNTGMTPVIPKTLLDNDDWAQSSSQYFRQQEFNLTCVQPNIFSDFPFTSSQESYAGSADAVMYAPTLMPHYLLSQQPTSPSSFSSYSSSSSDTEQPKRKRGRKKRDSPSNTSTQPLKPASPAMIAPAPARQLATILPAFKPKAEYTNNVSSSVPDVLPEVNVSSPQPQVSVKTETNNPQIPTTPDKAVMDSQKAATIAKRQERLIKNRAAALLSRKRKREHLTALEDQRKDLSNANQALQQRVLELEKENMALKSKMREPSHSFERSSSEIISMVSYDLV
jgi:hypothetical protein